MASYRSNINCTVLSTESVSTVSCTSGTGDTGRHSTSVLQTGEIDKLVSQIKCKRTFQDDDSLNGQATAVYSSPAVSQLFGLICGPDKQDLKPDTRESLKDLEQFYKDLIKGTCVSNGSSVKEGLNELFHNPEHVVFQDLLVKEPVDWSKELILPLLESIQRKEALKEELQKNVRETQKKRRELAKEIGLERKRLGEIKVMRKDKVDKMHPDNIRRLTIGLEADNAEVAKLEEMQSKAGPTVTSDEMEDLVKKFTELKARREKLREELNRVSGDGSLPPDLQKAREVISSKKTYLESLLQTQSNRLGS